MTIKQLTFFLLFYFITYSGNLFAWNTLTDKIDIHCLQAVKTLNCNYRLFDSNKQVSITAKSDRKDIKISNQVNYSDSSNITAILFLVDTSDPGRQNVIVKNKQHIKELIAAAKPHQKFGLASFDKTLTVNAPIGSSGFILNKNTDLLKAKGKTTELYRSLLKAIQNLGKFDAQRKAIILLSDGQAEDKAYFHSDVVSAARKSGIVINSIGYPRSIPLSVALQTIRRVSEETGGTYFETDMNFTLPKEYINSAFNNIESGGSFSINTNDVKTNKIHISFNTDNFTENLNVPIKLPKANNLIKPIVPEKTGLEE
ncbi:MAG: VWA domain-containing protein, partial [Proteobacteria bacterium]|nr:VWA domain-containing protein [Pseudomonadota bacterium]